MYTYSAYKLDATDLTRQVLTNHSDTPNSLSTVLFSANDYNKIGAAYRTEYACYMKVKDEEHSPPTPQNNCAVKLVVMLARDYE